MISPLFCLASRTRKKAARDARVSPQSCEFSHSCSALIPCGLDSPRAAVRSRCLTDCLLQPLSSRLDPKRSIRPRIVRARRSGSARTRCHSSSAAKDVSSPAFRAPQQLAFTAHIPARLGWALQRDPDDRRASLLHVAERRPNGRFQRLSLAAESNLHDTLRRPDGAIVAARLVQRLNQVIRVLRALGNVATNSYVFIAFTSRVWTAVDLATDRLRVVFRHPRR